MLTQCPECELPVSDKANTCPHCGYPLKPSEKQKRPRKSNKRRRLPNGFGQISEIKNRNLRNPFRAMVTVGKTPEGKPICKPLKPESYFATYNDAYAALVEYNKNPYDLEMDLLWTNISSKQGIDIMLIQCYSGWRPQELGLLELKDVDLENWTFRGGMKTDAGENRVVPIHSRIQDLVLRKYQEAEALGSPYLLNWTDPNNRNKKNLKLTYARYQKAFERIRDELKLNPNHRPHDGRTHFVTMAKRYGVDEYAIKYMVGHKISDITEKVYTRREFAWLREEIEKIK